MRLTAFCLEVMNDPSNPNRAPTGPGQLPKRRINRSGRRYSAIHRQKTPRRRRLCRRHTATTATTGPADEGVTPIVNEPAAEPPRDRLSDKIGRFVAIPHTFIEDMPNLPPCAHTLFMYLRSCVNKDTGNAFPAYKKIADETGLAVATICKGLDALVKRGWIKKKRQYGKNTIYELTIPASSISKIEILDTADEAPVFQELKHSISKIETSVFQKLKSNKNKATRIKEQEQQQAPQVKAAAAAGPDLSESENAILSELKTYGITSNKKTLAIVRKLAQTPYALDIVRTEAKKIANDRQNPAGVLISVLSNYDITSYKPPVKEIIRILDDY